MVGVLKDQKPLLKPLIAALKIKHWVLSTIFVTLDKFAILLMVGFVAGEWTTKKEGAYAWQKELLACPVKQNLPRLSAI